MGVFKLSCKSNVPDSSEQSERGTYKRVDGLETSLHWLVDGFSWNNTWSLQFNSLSGLGLEWSLSIDGVSEWVNDTSEDALSDGDIDDGSSSLDNISLLDLSVNRQK